MAKKKKRITLDDLDNRKKKKRRRYEEEDEYEDDDWEDEDDDWDDDEDEEEGSRKVSGMLGKLKIFIIIFAVAFFAIIIYAALPKGNGAKQPEPVKQEQKQEENKEEKKDEKKVDNLKAAKENLQKPELIASEKVTKKITEAVNKQYNFVHEKAGDFKLGSEKNVFALTGLTNINLLNRMAILDFKVKDIEAYESNTKGVYQVLIVMSHKNSDDLVWLANFDDASGDIELVELKGEIKRASELKDKKDDKKEESKDKKDKDSKDDEEEIFVRKKVKNADTDKKEDSKSSKEDKSEKKDDSKTA